MNATGHLDKVGIVGSIFSAACCLGISAFVSIATALGLGFLVKDAVLLPLFLVFLAITLVGLVVGYRKHRRPGALILGGIAGAVLFVATFVAHSRPLAYLNIAGLVAASIFNTILHRHGHGSLTQREAGPR